MAQLPKIRGTQIGLRHPTLVDRLKIDMKVGAFRFHEPDGQLGGILDRKGVYHVMEGHHRMVAALELYRETSDDRYVTQLIDCGRWDRAPAPPISRPMPARSWFGRLRNRVGY
jgi:hypothetical protein